jgi:large subunit ribosomal protein L4
MIKYKVYNQKGESVGEQNLSDRIFKVKVNTDLVHQAVVTQMANQRPVLAHTKDRSEVSGGGKKPWRQKGTGRARAGSNRSPIWIGGGVTFGPTKDRNFKKKINLKMKQKAMFMALSDKVEQKSLVILDKLDIAEFQTSVFKKIVEKIEEKIDKKENKKRSLLIIADKLDDKSKYSARNLTGLKLINLDNINIVDLLKYRDLAMTKAAVKKIEERLK